MAYAFFGSLALLFLMKATTFLLTRCSSPRKEWWEFKGAAFGRGREPLVDPLEATELQEMRDDRLAREADQRKIKVDIARLQREVRELQRRGEASGTEHQPALQSRAPPSLVVQPANSRISPAGSSFAGR